MGLFSSKIAGIIIGGSTVGLVGIGLTFTGSPILDGATKDVKDFGDRLVQFYENEGTFKEKINSLRANANHEIGLANASIANLEGENADLQKQKADLEAQKVALNNKIKLNNQMSDLSKQIAALETKLNTETANHQATKDQLVSKQQNMMQRLKSLLQLTIQLKT
ncbi:hypothetical protein ACQKM1_08180 [Peribacillus frigoritolerans]|uniref:hypothetical protein n=1 Tax=Peribacillus frigoritolerans TaxID=450367 RepID=UPI003D015481